MAKLMGTTSRPQKFIIPVGLSSGSAVSIKGVTSTFRDLLLSRLVVFLGGMGRLTFLLLALLGADTY